MSEMSKWASFVRAERLAQNFNQSEFAKAIGVSQQTVSRWESGGQIPDSSIQARLKQRLQATALGSTAYWKYRVATSRGHEILIDRDMTVLAVSQRALATLGLVGTAIEGMGLAGLVPEFNVAEPTPMGLGSLEQFRDIGFFDGLIRSVRLETEWHLPHGSCACKMDVWPILTSEQTIIGHFCGAPTLIAKSADGFSGIRVKHVGVRLNKDAQDE